MTYHKFIAGLLFLLCFEPSQAQHRIKIIDTEIKSLQIFANQNISTFPSINLNSNEVISITFDDLHPNAPRNLTYKIVHCDENWTDENLFQATFLDGFQEQPLYNSGFSNNTLTRYVHYSINFPNNDVKPKISGNYMIIISDTDTQQPLLKAGFMVVEKRASHIASIAIPTNSSYQTSHQLNLTVLLQELNVTNPTRDVKTKVYQNYVELPDSLQPQSVNTGLNSIFYSRTDKNIYPAGNEFRTIDIRDVHYTSTNVSSIKQGQDLYYILLRPDKSRDDSPYAYTFDYNGKMVIAGLNVNNPNTDCDYYSVMFSLSTPYLGDSFDVYLEGELTGWGPSNHAKMLYNNTTNCYEIPLLLKQGFYSYVYVVRNHNGDALMQLSPEGNFSQTENSYQICTYYKGIRDTYTRLISTTTIEQNKKASK
ncbi:type IX secretion system plug protein [Acetobacteroides hydrogenigenes]|uniref:Uncharacterized protein DUF5103 n=1 Tax=Acetobacteroides hydrogenigenes TaxID=979970 RepID=A0A4R2EQN3_9BACT|nr:type IX secretion system plug protein domain-containing protein [Acetobacteroides hydrogenigenes]TCN70697.1 uncharacterized protein DUF5103 [Acetobacteroides hydrogenigenes]